MTTQTGPLDQSISTRRSGTVTLILGVLVAAVALLAFVGQEVVPRVRRLLAAE